MTAPARWQLGCLLEFEVDQPVTIALQVAPAACAGDDLRERLEVTVDGHPFEAERLGADHRGAVHVLRVGGGELRVSYEAELVRPGTAETDETTVLGMEQLTYLRQSRYCPSDHLAGFAAYELGHLPPGPDLLAAVGAWVGSRLTYTSGASGPQDTAVDSLFAGRGVCRDFAHLAITMLRALEVPARLVSVYAPGLSPMDFHAVVEAHVDGLWRVLDPTRLAPRTSLVRVSTGRDAADTAFVTVLGGKAELTRSEVTAVVDGDLPVDDHTALASLA